MTDAESLTILQKFEGVVELSLDENQEAWEFRNNRTRIKNPFAELSGVLLRDGSGGSRLGD